MDVRLGVPALLLNNVRVGVLSNKRAGGGSSRAGRVGTFLKGQPDVPVVEPEGADGVGKALAVLAGKGVDVVAVNGGDGTLQHALTALLRERPFAKLPLIAPLRSGRTNMSALDIGSDRDPVKAVAGLLRAARDDRLEERIVRRPVLRVDFFDERPAEYGMFCGLGLIHRAIRLTHSVFPNGRSRGVFGSTLVTAALAARLSRGSDDAILAPDEMEISLDDEPVAAPTFKLVLATTLDRLFFRLRPFWGKESAPIRFTAILPGAAPSAASVLRMAYGRVRENPRSSDLFTSRNVRHGELHVDCGLTIDGEMFEPREDRKLRIDADESLRFVRT